MMRLRQLPAEASVAFAVRVGLRVLPWMAQPNDQRALATWPEKDRARHLLAVLRAFDVGLMAVWNRHASGLPVVARARRDAAAAYAAATAYAGSTAATAAAAAAAAAATAAAAADAATATAAAANGVITEFVSELKVDLSFLSKNNAMDLIESPLWNIIPPSWPAQLIRFQEAARGLDSGFDIWLHWYDALCRGAAIDVEQLRQRVFLSAAVSEQSPQQINAYLTSIAQGKLAGPLNRVRTIFIGDGEAGKTSLIRVLNNQAVVEGIEAKTPGIDIREWPVPGTDIKASFWDFGGQVMVHATHQLFLRDSCLYVLLVSAREKEKATERAEYWLEHVKSFGKGAPVLIVANKADKEPVRLDENLLQDKYPGMIKGFFQLACTEAKGSFRSQFAQFRDVFCRQLQAVGLHQVQFHKAHFAVLENLRRRTPGQAFLTHQDYAQLCQEHRVDAHGALDSAWLLDILDKLGVIVHFPEMAEMEEYILNPRWLTYGIYTVMYNEQARMSRQQVVKLLAAKPVLDQDGNTLSYAPGKCHIVFEAMRRYKLCYFLPRDPDQLIIPALLPSDIKQHGFDTVNALEFHYQFESFLPRHLISELIVECHEDIATITQNDVATDIVWQHGVLLDNATHHTRALIQADYHFRRLSIWLTKQSAATEFLAMLRDKVEKIVKRIDIRYAQNIRLPHEARIIQGTLPGEAEWANFKLVLAHRNKGRTKWISETGTDYSIPKILGFFAHQTPQGGNPGQGETVNNTFHISNSHIGGNVSAAKTIQDSFNDVDADASHSPPPKVRVKK